MFSQQATIQQHHPFLIQEKASSEAIGILSLVLSVSQCQERSWARDI